MIARQGPLPGAGPRVHGGQQGHRRCPLGWRAATGLVARCVSSKRTVGRCCLESSSQSSVRVHKKQASPPRPHVSRPLGCPAELCLEGGTGVSTSGGTLFAPCHARRGRRAGKGRYSNALYSGIHGPTRTQTPGHLGVTRSVTGAPVVTSTPALPGGTGGGEGGGGREEGQSGHLSKQQAPSNKAWGGRASIRAEVGGNPMEAGGGQR